MAGRLAAGSPKSDLIVVLLILVMLIVPASLTLMWVHDSSQGSPPPQGTRPHGYSVSLVLFLIPVFTLMTWLVPRDCLQVSKQSLIRTIALLFPLGGILDFFFAHAFLRFPNLTATLSIPAPALGLVDEGVTHREGYIFWSHAGSVLIGSVPIEEYVFYLSGFSAILLQYVWLDEYWLAAYSVPVDGPMRSDFDRLLRFHPASTLFAIALIVGAVLYRRIIYGTGFPGYFTFLVVAALGPSSFLFDAAVTVINWRALSIGLLVTVLTSLLWEVTLALPYGWWGYQGNEMIGLPITAWHSLPIEAVCVWIAATYMTVMTYEVVKRWKASGRTLRHALIGGN